MHRCFPTLRAIRVLLLPAALAAMLLGPSGSADAQINYVPTLHSEYQEVFDDGSPAWSGGSISMTGVVINNYWDMLYYSDVEHSPNYSPSPQWQVFFQATEPAKAAGDFGGTAMYMRRYHPMSGDDLYLGNGWAEEMDRLNFPVYEPTGKFVTDPLQRGDLIRVEAKAPGMFFRGKYNINTQHTNDPNKEFSITIVERNVPLVAPLITLAHLKDEYDNFIFEESREAGCEHYQASLVRLENLYLQEPEDGVDWGDYWSLYNTVTVLQSGRTFPMQLGLDPDLEAIDASALVTTPFHVTAILNQEDPDFPFKGEYSLWLTSAMDLTIVPEPGTALLAVFGAIACLLLPLRRRWR